MKVYYCPQCGESVISHYKLNVLVATYNEFYCKKCWIGFTVRETEISEKAEEFFNKENKNE